MKSSHGMFLGMSLVIGAMLISFANAGATVGSGKFALSSSEGIAYRMNTETGEISVCIKGMTMEEALGCSPWAR